MRERVGVVELLGAVLQVAQRGADGSFLIGNFRGFGAGAQDGEDWRGVAGAERGDEAFGVGGFGGRFGQILADVIQIDGVTALGAKLNPGLVGNPQRAVAEGVNLGVQAPAGGPACIAPSAGRCRRRRAGWLRSGWWRSRAFARR